MAWQHYNPVWLTWPCTYHFLDPCPSLSIPEPASTQTPSTKPLLSTYSPVHYKTLPDLCRSLWSLVLLVVHLLVHLRSSPLPGQPSAPMRPRTKVKSGRALSCQATFPEPPTWLHIRPPTSTYSVLMLCINHRLVSQIIRPLKTMVRFRKYWDNVMALRWVSSACTWLSAGGWRRLYWPHTPTHKVHWKNRLHGIGDIFLTKSLILIYLLWPILVIQMQGNTPITNWKLTSYKVWSSLYKCTTKGKAVTQKKA